MANGMICSMWK